MPQRGPAGHRTTALRPGGLPGWLAAHQVRPDSVAIALPLLECGRHPVETA